MKSVPSFSEVSDALDVTQRKISRLMQNVATVDPAEAIITCTAYARMLAIFIAAGAPSEKEFAKQIEDIAEGLYKDGMSYRRSSGKEK